MWFSFGIVTLAVFTIFSIVFRLRETWMGAKATRNGRSYEWKASFDDRKKNDLLVGVEAPENCDFYLKPERWYDRLFKGLGLSVEYQVGNETFDSTIYIVSDDPRLCANLGADNKLRESILRIVKAVTSINCWMVEIRCRKNKLWVKVKLPRKSEALVPSLTQELIGPLWEIADRLPQVLTAEPNRLRDKFVLRAAVILAISTGMIIHGGVHLIRMHFVTTPFLVDAAPLVLRALLVGAVIIGVLVVVAVVLLGRSARAHLVVLELLLAGSFGAVATSFIELRDINMDWDMSQGRAVELPVLGKHVSRGRRSSTFYLHLPDWTRTDRRERDIIISASFWSDVQRGQTVRLVEHPGWFGVRWVESIEIIR